MRKLMALLGSLLCFSACVPHHQAGTKATVKQPPANTVAPPQEAVAKIVMPAEVTAPLPPAEPESIRPPRLPVLLQGLPADDLHMLAQRAEQVFPEHAWKTIADNSRLVRRRIEDVLQQSHSPLSLEVIPAIESKYDPYEVSAAGAAGLWQFMPATAKSLGLSCSPLLNDVRHVEKSTQAAVRYLKRLRQRFEYWPLALAAYNCGPARLARFLRQQGGWQPADGLDRLPAPKASKAYVKNILSLVYARHTGLRSFPEAIPVRQVQTRGADIPHLGKALNLSAETLLRLNPQLERIRYGEHVSLQLCIPDDAPWNRAQDAISHVSQAMEAPRFTRVKPGDSLWKIARRHHLSVALLRRANPHLHNILQPGQRLRLPARHSRSNRNPLCR